MAGISQLPFVDKGLPSAGLLTVGAPRGETSLVLAGGDLPCAEGRELLPGNSGIGESTSRVVAANASKGERTTVSTSVGA